MRRGKRPDRNSMRVVLLLGTFAAIAGCHRLPVQPIPPAADSARTEVSSRNEGTAIPNREPGPSERAASGVPALPEAAVVDTSLAKNTPTPLLDAAIEKAQAFRASTPPAPAGAPTPEAGAAAEEAASPSAAGTPGATVAKSAAPAEERKPVELVANAVRPDPPRIAPQAGQGESHPSPEPSPPSSAGKAPLLGSEDTWQVGINHLKSIARGHAGAGATDGNLWNVRLRALDWLSAQPGDASVHPSEKEVLREFIRQVAGAEAMQEDREPDSQIRRTDHDAEPPLRIADLQLCKKVHGFGSYDLLDEKALEPKQTVILYCEMDGLRLEELEGRFHSKLESRVELLADGREEPLWSQPLGTAEDECRRRRRDYYVNYRFSLPEGVGSGEYRLRLVQKDALAGSETMRDLVVRIEGSGR